jgi:tetratricopeptide (TPR) repeat protein
VLGGGDAADPPLAGGASALDDAAGGAALGLLHRRRGDLVVAVGAFRRALERDGDHSASLLNLGQLLVRTGAAEEGAELLERHRRLSLLEDRLDHLERSSRLAGATAGNFAALAEAQLRLGKKEEAIASYRRALELDPEHALAALGLASLLLERRQVDEATRWSVVALMAAPESFRTHYVLGMVRLAKGQYDDADRAFTASRERGDWDADAHLRVAEAYLAAGEHERAARELDRAAVTAPSDPRIATLRARLPGP